MIIRAIIAFALLLGAVAQAQPSGTQGLGDRLVVEKTVCKLSPFQVGRIVPVGYNKYGEAIKVRADYPYGEPTPCEKSLTNTTPAVLQTLPAKSSITPVRVPIHSLNRNVWQKYCEGGLVYQVALGRNTGNRIDMPVMMDDNGDVQQRCQTIRQLASN